MVQTTVENELFNFNDPSIALENELSSSENILVPENLLLIIDKTFNIIDSYYDIDPITMTQLWKVENDNKMSVYPDNKINELIYYYDSSNRLICFELESVKFLKYYNIKTHPITFDPIPSHIFNNINCIDIIINDDVESIAANVFKSLRILSVNINYKLFLLLSNDKLLKLYYELNDFWKHNLTYSQREIIKENIGHTIIFNKSQFDLKNNSLEEIQKYILIEMKLLLTCNIEEYKYIISYIIVCALSTVIPEINKDYPGLIYLDF